MNALEIRDIKWTKEKDQDGTLYWGSINEIIFVRIFISDNKEYWSIDDELRHITITGDAAESLTAIKNRAKRLIKKLILDLLK